MRHPLDDPLCLPGGCVWPTPPADGYEDGALVACTFCHRRVRVYEKGIDRVDWDLPDGVVESRWDGLLLYDPQHWIVPPNSGNAGQCHACRVPWPCTYALEHAEPDDEHQP